MHFSENRFKFELFRLLRTFDTHKFSNYFIIFNVLKLKIVLFLVKVTKYALKFDKKIILISLIYFSQTFCGSLKGTWV